MTIISTIGESTGLMEHALKAKLIPFLKGSPGIGKSAAVKALAKKYNLKLIDIRLAQADPTDLNGFPSIDKGANKATYIPMDTFPLVGDPIPAGYAGWLIFLDEINAAERGVQKAAYKTLEYQIGQHDMHPKVAIVCAGNLDTDGALIEDMSSALQSRMIHIPVGSDVGTWLSYAEAAGYDTRITSFIHFKRGALNNFDPDKQGEEQTYACERTWTFVNKLILTGLDPTSREALALFAGTVGEGIAREFIAYLSMYKELPTTDDVLRDPEGTRVPPSAGASYAMVGSIAESATEANMTAFIEYLSRMDMEYQVTCIRMIGAHSDKKFLFKNDAYKSWAARNSVEIF